jgi:uncharacterized protein (TIGR02145 family)
MNNSKYILPIVFMVNFFFLQHANAQHCIKHIVYKNNGQIDTLSVVKIDYDTMTTTVLDVRDAQSYKLVTIGNQLWMAENLRYDVPGVYGLRDTLFINSNTKYGRVYNWNVLMGGDSLSPTNNNPSGVKGICPNGFHLPSRSEWFEMEISIGLNLADTSLSGFRGTHADAMKSTSGWASNMNGSNSSGFNSYPAGVNHVGFGGLTWVGKRAAYWSTTDSAGSFAYLVSNDTFNQGVENTLASTSNGFSVSCRCIADSLNVTSISNTITADYHTTGGSVYHYHMANIDSVVIIPACTCPDSVTDSRDNETYAVIKIGDDCWMAENLRYDVPGVFGSSDTVNSANPSLAYGRLYDWATLMNGASTSSSNPSGVQGICPSGWHLPSDSEWNELEMALGMSAVDTANTSWRGVHGTAMKSLTGWNNSGNGTNASGFNAFPAGYYYSGSFINLGGYAYFWSSTEHSVSNAWDRYLGSGGATVGRYSINKALGFSCRCVED